MTALAGIWRFDGKLDAGEACARMLKAQERYGSDSGAQWLKGGVALGRRLMRLLPEDAFDRQPLIGGGGRFTLVADLRLDNRDELIENLQIDHASASRSSDAAILLAAFERWEEDCLGRIVGEYAFAIWNESRRQLVLARDPLGFRPLFYHRGNGFFAFSSMPKGLHALPEVPYGPDEAKIAESLVLLPDAGTRSFFLGIDRVIPAHGITVSASGQRSWRHWKPARRLLALSGPDEYVARARELLDEAVRCRLRGVKNVAATLSGGLDSSAVVATAARLLAPSGGRVIAITGVPREGYDGPSTPGFMNDESQLAAATAAMYPNVEHVVVHAPNRSPLADLDGIFLHSERPMLAICNLGLQNRIIEIASDRDLSVMLGGAFGNFGLSYDGKQLLPELFGQGQLVRWWRVASALVSRERWSWLHTLAETVGPWLPGAIWMWILRTRRGDDTNIFAYSAINPHRFAELDLGRRARETGRDLAGRPWSDGFVQRTWCLDRCDSGDLLKGGLAEYRIDLREPLADVRLLEFCLAVPTSEFLRNGTLRALARHTLADRLPKLVLENRRAGMDSADWHERLTAARGEIAREIDRLAAYPLAARALDLPRLRRLVHDWPAGGWERPEISSAYRLALLRAISTGHFLRRVTGGNQ